MSNPTTRMTDQVLGGMRMRGMTADQIDTALAGLEDKGLVRVQRRADGTVVEVELLVAENPIERRHGRPRRC